MDEFIKSVKTEDSYHGVMAISAAQARAEAYLAQCSAMILVGMGVLATMATAILLAIKVYQCEKRIHRLEGELAGQRTENTLPDLPLTERAS